MAGLSLGEYSALEAAGVFTAKQAVELAAFRGKAMADAAKGIECGMTAVLNLDRGRTGRVLRRGVRAGLCADLQLQLPGPAGHRRRKGRRGQRLRSWQKPAGARRCIPLKVSGPFHTQSDGTPPGMPWQSALPSEHFRRDGDVPVLFNCLGREKADSDSIPALLVRQVQSSVYMEDTLRRLGELGVDRHSGGRPRQCPALAS